MVFKLKFKTLHKYLIGESKPITMTYIDAVQMSYLTRPRDSNYPETFLYVRMMLD